MNQKSKVQFATIAALVFIVGISSALADTKIGPRLQQRLNQKVSRTNPRAGKPTFPVIVEFVDQVDLKTLTGNKKDRRKNLLGKLKAKHTKSRLLIRRLLRRYGVTRKESLWLINGESFDAPRALIEDLAAEPSVRQIRLNYQIMAPGAGSGSAAPAEWNLNRIGAPTLWGLGITGLGIVVANMDTGVDINHSELAATWRGGSNSWYDPHCHPAPWEDPVLFQPAASCPANTDFTIPRDKAAGSTGHGSGTIGIMVGGDAGGTSIGVAPDAQWIASKIFDDNAAATLTAIHKAFQWLLDPDNDPLTDDAPDIVNASWVLGGPDVNECVLEFQPDLQALRAADIAVVFSAGNEGGTGNPNTSTSPGNNPEGYAVGAIDSADRAGAFSSRGPGPAATVCETGFFPELVAPGVSVRTTGKNAIPTVDNYPLVSGTSFAAPHVAGAMALLLDALPNLTVPELETVLLDTAQDTSSVDDAMGPDDIYGYGVLHVESAYYALCPTTSLDSDSDGIPDVCDNCTLRVNPSQADTDSDLYGDVCDGDFDNNGIVNFGDITIHLSLQGQTGPEGDFDNNSIVNFGDITILLGFMNKAPGPSGLAP